VNLNQEHYLIANGLLVTIVVLAMLLGRKRVKRPVSLDMHAEDAEPNSPARGGGLRHASGQFVAGWSDYRPRASSYLSGTETQPTRSASGPDLLDHDHGSLSNHELESIPFEKILKVHFNWNGHSWDAYEVLGLPAGSSIESAALCLRRESQRCDPESVPFLQAAFDAIAAS
jgi:hypothetical protein